MLFAVLTVNNGTQPVSRQWYGNGTAGRNLRTRGRVDRSRSLCYHMDEPVYAPRSPCSRESPFPYIAKRSTGERNRIIMSTITQEAYDEEIRELMEGLGMTEEEAIEDAIKCYEMKVLTAASLCLHRLSIGEKYPFCSLRATMWLIHRASGIFTFGKKKRDFKSSKNMFLGKF